MTELDKLLKWWRADAGRAKCTLEQIVALYNVTFPGRTHRLLMELIGEKMDEDPDS